MFLGDFLHKMGHHHIFGGDEIAADQLSPVSALRLNFDQLAAENIDDEEETKNIFGVSMPQFVPQRVLSWIENSNSANGGESNADTNSNASGSSVVNNNQHSMASCVCRKVCPFSYSFLVFAVRTKSKLRINYSFRRNERSVTLSLDDKGN